jgi:hypothetical protein
MTITWGERPKRKASYETLKKVESDREYWVSGTLIGADAIYTIASVAPPIDIESLADATGAPIPLFLNKFGCAELGGGNWTVTVHYENTPNQYSLKFNNGVQTTKIRQALEHIRVYDCINGGSHDGAGQFTDGIPDFQGAIGVTGDGANITVEGSDTEIGKVEFSITKKLRMSTLPSSYMQMVIDMTPCKNDRQFTFIWKGQIYTFAKGSIKFRGMPTDENSEDETEMVYYFAYSKGSAASSIPVFDPGLGYSPGEQVIFGGNIYECIVITTVVIGTPPPSAPTYWQDLGPDGALRVAGSDPIVKEGWDLAWPWYRPVVANGSIIVTPAAIVIDRILDYGNLDLLNL